HWHRKRVMRIERFISNVRLELARFPIPRMRSVEADRKTKWLVRPATIDEFERFIPEPGCRMLPRRIVRLDKPFSRLTRSPPPKIEFCRSRADVSRVAHSELSDKARAVTASAKQRRVG